MTFRPKLWASVGACALVGTASPSVAAAAVEIIQQAPARATGAPIAQEPASRVQLVQTAALGGEGGEGGEAGERRASAVTHARPVVHRKPRPKIHHAPVRQHRDGSGGEGGKNGARPHSLGGEGGEPGHVTLVGAGGEGGEGGVPLSGPGGEGGVNSRYIFGFTEGADVERYREREIENDTVFRGGKRSGSYFGVSNKTELEYGVSDNLLAAFGAFFSANAIRNVPGLDDRSEANFNGLSGELKYRILDRASSPFGLGVSVEPEWHRFSGTSGRRENSYGVETKLYIDKELIPGTLFGAINLLYEPEVAHVKEFNPDTGRFVNWERESTFGVSGALAYLLSPGLFVGGEVRYLASYSGTYLNRFKGDAVFVGPTLSWRFAPRALIQAAYSVQVNGKSLDDPDRHLNLDGFERHQARLRFVYEF